MTGEQVITDYRPSMPASINKWDIWQYSSRIKVPGEYYAYDFDYFPGTLDDLKRKCGIAVGPIEPTLEEKVNEMWTWYKKLNP